MNAVADRIEFRFALRLVDMSEPLPWAFDWPCCQDIGTRYLGMSPKPQATPSPIFRFLTQIGLQHVSFHVPKHAKQVVVLFMDNQ